MTIGGKTDAKRHSDALPYRMSRTSLRLVTGSAGNSEVAEPHPKITSGPVAKCRLGSSVVPRSICMKREDNVRGHHLGQVSI